MQDLRKLERIEKLRKMKLAQAEADAAAKLDAKLEDTYRAVS